MTDQKKWTSPGGMSVREVAAALGISKNLVAYYERKALRKLAKRLRQLGLTAEDLKR